MTIDFGWEIPTGRRRMPGAAATYEPHLRRVLDRMSGHFHSAWMPDHFIYDDTNVPEALTTVNYLAGLYPRLHFGAVVLGQNYRNPALVAKMAATTQWLTGGRLILGLGAGWKEDEYRAYGYEFPPIATRIAQLAEAAHICKLMWDPARPSATFHGQHYHIETAVCNPKPADIRKTWMGVVSIAPTHAQAEAAMVGFPIWPEDVPIVGTPAEVIHQVQHYTSLGVDCFILGFADEPGLAGIELFINEVAPYFRR